MNSALQSESNLVNVVLKLAYPQRKSNQLSDQMASEVSNEPYMNAVDANAASIATAVNFSTWSAFTNRKLRSKRYNTSKFVISRLVYLTLKSFVYFNFIQS